MIALIFFNIKIHNKRQGWKTRKEDIIGNPMEIPCIAFKSKIKKEHKVLGIYDISACTIKGKAKRISKKNPNQNNLSYDFIWITFDDLEKAKEIDKIIKESKNKFLDKLFNFYKQEA